jgi:group I intron endonuclease
MVRREDNIYFRIGIYGIRNLVNGKIYVGKTGMNFGDRWDSHRSLLNNGKHDNLHLQNAWNKYKEENFEFIVLEDCEVDELSEREKYYIKLYKDMDLAYNIHDGGDEGYNLGKHLSEETKRKIGEKNRINGLGRKASDETKEKMSKSHAGMKYTPMSEEGRKNIQRAQQKYFENNPKKLCVDDVIEIRKLHRDGLNYSEIARKYNVTPQCINDICNYKRWKQVH